MIISGEKKFIVTNFDSEKELEDLVFSNFEYLFGSSSFLLPKRKIRTEGGAGTIPDGFVIDLENKCWYLVEVELAHHGVWTHIAPQISKQIIACQNTMTRKLLVELSVTEYKENPKVKEVFEEKEISEIDVRKILSEIFETVPLIGIPIDNKPIDLESWSNTLKNTVKLWEVRKFSDFTDPSNIIYEFPEEHKPSFVNNIEETQDNNELSNGDFGVYDLIQKGLLNLSEQIEMKYKPRTGELKVYKGTINSDGSISVLNRSFSSLSYAALACITDAGSNRKTVNGWTSWKNSDGFTLAELREKYFKNETNGTTE